MVTIKDIARAAGVAQGTVSNVLNNRGNVSSDKIRRVMEACDALGYIPNERAKQLRQSKSSLLGVVLPDLNDRRHIDFYLSFKAYANDHGYTVRQYIYSGIGSASSSEAIAQDATRDGVCGLVVYAGSQHMMQTPLFADIPVLYADHRPQFKARYIGFDYHEAGRAMALRLKNTPHKRIVLLTGQRAYSNTSDFISGFSEIANGTGMRVTHIETDRQTEHLALLHSREFAAAQAVICSRLELAQVARRMLSTFMGETTPPIYTISPLFTLPEKDYEKYELNYRLLGNAAAQSLIRQLSGGAAPKEQILKSSGFRTWNPPPLAVPAKHPLNVITLDNPSSDIMRDLSRLYTQQTGVPVNITVYSYDETYEIFGNMRESAVFDVIRLDMTWLSFFAQRILRPLEEIDPAVKEDLSRFLTGTDTRYAYVGDTLYALPSSPSTQTLFYRRDLFQNAMYRRMYLEQTSSELTVPKDFDEYNRIAAFFTRELNPDSPVEYGSTLTLGSTAVACSEYLARLFALQKNLYGPDGKVNLSGENYVRALEQLVALRACSNPAACVWWRNTAAAFAAGNTAMAIMYNHYASPLVGNASRVRDCVGFALTPGGRPLLGGGSMGVSRFTDQPEQALHFIRWLCSEPVSSALTFMGGVSPCRDSYDNYEIINTYPWLKSAPGSFSAARGFRMPFEASKPFDERRFMSIIGMAVKNAFSGALPPQKAMDYAQKLFEEQFGSLYR